MADSPCITNDDVSLPFDKHVFDLSFGGAEKFVYPKQQKIRLDGQETVAATPSTAAAKSASQLISEALQAMSLEDKQRAQEDMHGIDFDDDGERKETDELFKKQKLAEMDLELQRLKTASTWSLQLAGIEMAERQNIDYVKNEVFRLKFLRCELWDSSKAAARFIRHFDWKLELFGEEKLAKAICIEDLEPEDVKMLKKGYFQRLPERDRAGRALFCQIYKGQTYPSPQSLVSYYSGVEAPCSAGHF
jgi:hypothetical protein